MKFSTIPWKFTRMATKIIILLWSCVNILTRATTAPAGSVSMTVRYSLKAESWTFVKASLSSFQIKNNAGAPIQLYWINIFNKTLVFPDNLVAQTKKPIRNNKDTLVCTHIGYRAKWLYSLCCYDNRFIATNLTNFWCGSTSTKKEWKQDLSKDIKMRSSK